MLTQGLGCIRPHHMYNNTPCFLQLLQLKYTMPICTVLLSRIAVTHTTIFFLLVQTKVSWRTCSPYGTRESLSESRFRAVRCYNDPTNDCGSGSDT